MAPHVGFAHGEVLGDHARLECSAFVQVRLGQACLSVVQALVDTDLDETQQRRREVGHHVAELLQHRGRAVPVLRAQQEIRHGLEADEARRRVGWAGPSTDLKDARAFIARCGKLRRHLRRHIGVAGLELQLEKHREERRVVARHLPREVLPGGCDVPAGQHRSRQGPSHVRVLRIESGRLAQRGQRFGALVGLGELVRQLGHPLDGLVTLAHLGERSCPGQPRLHVGWIDRAEL
ncbi:MAG: hypothetical protein QGI02_02910, partial [Vicinamibacterales bacterium]|nr:hypothetical protein [Vicinamibacterales bacterium]